MIDEEQWKEQTYGKLYCKETAAADPGGDRDHFFCLLP